MNLLKKIKKWLKKNKKKFIICGTAALAIVGSGIGFVLYKNNKISFSDWLKIASREELEEAYEKLRLSFCETGTRPYGMEQIGQELGERGAKEWFKKHPPIPDTRWTDANRWEKD